MSGFLRNIVCFCFVGLMVGSLWLFAQTANVPHIPPWREGETKPIRVDRAQYRADARIDCVDEYEVDDIMTTAAFDNDGEYSRRST